MSNISNQYNSVYTPLKKRTSPSECRFRGKQPEYSQISYSDSGFTSKSSHVYQSVEYLALSPVKSSVRPKSGFWIRKLFTKSKKEKVSPKMPAKKAVLFPADDNQKLPSPPTIGLPLPPNKTSTPKRQNERLQPYHGESSAVYQNSDYSLSSRRSFKERSKEKKSSTFSDITLNRAYLHKTNESWPSKIYYL